jgi:transcriptional regulator with XRE-family HTH domain
MKLDEPSFGKFLIQKRKERDLSARQLAIQLKFSAVYICDIEKERRPVPNEILGKLCEILFLNKSEIELMYDLVAKSKNTISADLPEYIMENDIVRAALRTAKENNIEDVEWEEFINRITRKKDNP